MVVTKRQEGESRKNRAEEGPRTGAGTSGRMALQPKPNLHRTGPGGRKKHTKRGAKGCTPAPSTRNPALFSSRLWIHVPSLLQDGFSCYYLNKIEL